MIAFRIVTFWFSLLAGVIYYHRDAAIFVELRENVTEWCKGFWSPWHYLILHRYPEYRESNGYVRNGSLQADGEFFGVIAALILGLALLVTAFFTILWAVFG